MQDHQPPRISLGLLVGVSALILTTGSAAAWWSWNTYAQQSTRQPATEATQASRSQTSEKSPAVAANQPKAETESATIPSQSPIQVYWLKTSGTEISLTPSPVTSSIGGTSNAQIGQALEELLEGPQTPAATTTIPKGTTLRQVDIKPDGIHVDLSKEFTQGGGSASMTGRLAQVLYTATTLDPKAKVWLSVDGKPLETLGGEGLVLEQPLTRQQFDQNFDL